MKLNEIREILKGLTQEQLSALLVEVYRSVPKAIREKAGLDSIITRPPAADVKRASKAPKTPPDMDNIRWEAEEFMENAYAQNYFAPNRTVSKKDRPKWRFIVMRLYKDLQAAAGDPECQEEAADLLFRIYKVLCEATQKVLFNSYDPFESVRITQADLFRSVLALKRQALAPEKFVEFAVQHATTDPLNRYTLHSGLIECTLEFFPTPDAKDLALEVCGRLRKAIRAKPASQRYDGYTSSSNRDNLNALTAMTFTLHWALRDEDAAIADFKTHAAYETPEIALFILIRDLFRTGSKDLILREYDEALRRGIKPREQLRKFVKTIRETGNLPAYFG